MHRWHRLRLAIVVLALIGSALLHLAPAAVETIQKDQGALVKRTLSLWQAPDMFGNELGNWFTGMSSWDGVATVRAAVIVAIMGTVAAAGWLGLLLRSPERLDPRMRRFEIALAVLTAAAPMITYVLFGWGTDALRRQVRSSDLTPYFRIEPLLAFTLLAIGATVVGAAGLLLALLDARRAETKARDEAPTPTSAG